MAFRVGTSEDSGGIQQDDIYRLVSEVTQLEGQMPPVGSIMPFIGVTYATNNNVTPSYPLGSTVANIKSYIESATDGRWVVCDGSIISDPESPWNGRRVPGLTDERFLMGSTGMGASGGKNTHSNSLANLACFGANASISESKACFVNSGTSIVITNSISFSTWDNTNNTSRFVFDDHRHCYCHVHQWGYSVSPSGSNRACIYMTTSGGSGNTGFTTTGNPRLNTEARTNVGGNTRVSYTVSGINATSQCYFTGGAGTSQNTSDQLNCGNVNLSYPNTEFSWSSLNNNTYQTCHNHGNKCESNANSNTSSSINFDNRPLYLTSFFIIRIK